MTGAGGTRALRALVVDDKEHLARLIADYLAREGFATDVALDGERALELARAQHPDVIVLNSCSAFRSCGQRGGSSPAPPRPCESAPWT